MERKIVTDLDVNASLLATQTNQIQESADELSIVKLATKKNAWFFVKNFCYTYDPHNRFNKIVKFPDFLYLEYTSNIWQNTQFLLVPKSRQLMISWLMCALHLWLAHTFPGEYILFQSLKEEKAGWGGSGDTDDIKGDPQALLSRVFFMYKYLPNELKVPYTVSKKPPTLTFHHEQVGGRLPSVIRGVSSDFDDFRLYAATAIFADELAFQANAGKAFAAAMPVIGKQGRYTGVSSSNFKGFFHILINDLAR